MTRPRPAAAAVCLFLSLLLLLTGCMPEAPSSQSRPESSELSSEFVSELSSEPVSELPSELSSELSSDLSSEPVSKPVSEPVSQLPDKGPETHPIEINAASALLYEEGADRLLYAKNIHRHAAPASLTKLVTACTALSFVPEDAVFTVGSERDLVPAGSSICLLQKGHRLTLKALLYGLLLRSGNDAAYTIAVNTARSHTGNPDMSDQEALASFNTLTAEFTQRLGLKDSVFLTPDGFDLEGQHTSAADLLRISLCALKHSLIAEIVQTRQKQVIFASGEVANWSNSNKLLQKNSPYYDPDANGLKTGTTPDAGSCLIASAIKNGKLRIAVVLGCPDDDTRYRAAETLLNL